MENEKDIFDFIKAKQVDVPDAAYFADLANKITTPKSVKVIPIYRKPVFWMSSAAAAIVLLFAVFNFSETTSPQAIPLVAMNDIDTELIYSYVEENIHDFDAELFSEFISTDDISSNTTELFEVEIESQASIETNAISFDNITEDDILNYFETEEISLTDFEDDLFI